jgi:hypothetical protein
MNIKRVILAIVVILVGASVYQFFFSPGAQVNRTINKARVALEKGDIEECFKYVSQGYHDSFGYNYKGLKQALARTFNNSGGTTILIIRQNKKVTLNQCEATLQVIINVSSAEFGSLRGQEFVRLAMNKEADGYWRCVKAEILQENPFSSAEGILGHKETL